MATPKWSLQVSGLTGLRRGLKAVGETDVPHMRSAFTEAGRVFTGAARSHAIGSMVSKTHFGGVTGTQNTIRAVVVTDHPGAKAMEFGRHWWTTGAARDVETFTLKRQQRRVRRGLRTRVRHDPGQVARPFYGIKTATAAVADTAQRIRELISAAISNEWDRLGSDK